MLAVVGFDPTQVKVSITRNLEVAMLVGSYLTQVRGLGKPVPQAALAERHKFISDLNTKNQYSGLSLRQESHGSCYVAIPRQYNCHC